MCFGRKGVSGDTEFQELHKGLLLFVILQPAELVIFPKLDREFRNTRTL